MAEKAEEVNHIVSTNRKQRNGNTGAEFTFSFLFYIPGPCAWNGVAHI